MWDTNGMVNAVLPVGDRIYVGGRFTLIGPHTGGGAPVSRATGLPVAHFPALNGSVYAAASDGRGGYYVGGSFTTAGGTARAGLMHMLGDGSLDPRWNPGVSGSVLTLAVAGSRVYAGGDFRSIGGRPRNRIAALDATTGRVTSWNPGANATVQTLAVSGSTVYAGGKFQRIGGQARNGLAALDAATGRAIPLSAPSLSGTFALAASGSRLYIGGDDGIAAVATTR